MGAPSDGAAISPAPATGRDSVEVVLRAGARRLTRAQVAQPGLDARLLLGHVLALGQTAMIVAGSEKVAAGDVGQYDQFLTRRAGGEPVSRILGVREFYSRQFHITPDVLDPRPDSECLVDAALKLALGLQKSPRILDLGTGSGCLLVTLLAQLPGATGVGLDISAPALLVARRNAGRHGVAGRAGFVAGNWCDAIGGV
ncbi:MAG: N5-glutamine methyltransferase family protein, partial [Alphaproteobacteria bacterium]